MVLVARLYLCAQLSLASCFINLTYPLPPSAACPLQATPLDMSCALSSPLQYLALFYPHHLNERGDKSKSSSPPFSASVRRLYGPSSFLVTCRERQGNGHYALLQSQASDVRLPCLLNTLQCAPPLLHEQRWWNKLGYLCKNGQLLCVLALAMCAQQFPRWLFKLHRDYPWIIHYLQPLYKL